MTQSRYERAMQRQKEAVNAGIARADQERSLLVLLTGDGKAKTTSGFGMVLRTLGWGQRAAVVQFIKGTQHSGEELLLRERFPEVPLIQMGTGFTWDSQNFAGDQAAAERTWAEAARLLQDPQLDLLLLDELTYMLAYRFLDEAMVLAALQQRRPGLSVVVTGRGGGTALRELADTVSEVRNVKHSYEQGIKARKGIDY
jgi:cob(I)alamin adenosyltransferase